MTTPALYSVFTCCGLRKTGTPPPHNHGDKGTPPTAAGSTSSDTGVQVMVRDEKTVLDTRFGDKDMVKDLGAKWDPDAKHWFVPPHANIAPFRDWIASFRVYLRCPFADKDEAKKLGARWDETAAQWYIRPSMDPAPFAKWMPLPR